MTIHRIPDIDCPVLLLKGAAERVLNICDKIMYNGEDQPLDQEADKNFQLAYETLGSMGERVLGFAYRKLEDYDLDYQFTTKP